MVSSQMEKTFKEQLNKNLPPVNNVDAVVRYFREGLASGKHWYIALLESIGLWTDEFEEFQGQQYRYLIEGEAFDWLLLAERLCESVNGLIPEDEKLALFSQNKPPVNLTPEQFKELIGISKYRQYLNYYYGVTVEDALVQVVREEVRKERRSNGLSYRREKEEEEVFTRVYGDTEASLLKLFRREKRYRRVSRSNLTEMKEFTYWRFKYRVKNCEKARVASDTHRALGWLRQNKAKTPG